MQHQQILLVVYIYINFKYKAYDVFFKQSYLFTVYPMIIDA